MAPSAKMIRNQLNLLKPILANLSLNTLRTGQDKMGELAEAIHRKQVLIKDHPFENFAGAWIIPKDLRREGVILYLHGGGYTCGSIDYATGFGSKLAVQSGARIFCAGYRLAPEHPYPAALEDALAAYRYLLNKGYAPSQICLCGESAGGGLCYSLCLKLKELDMPLPGSIIAISPWTDMTASGTSYAENKDLDPSMTLERLDFFAKCYGADPKDPLASPLFGDLHGMPPSLLFAGGDEIMRSDAQLMHQKLLDSRCSSTLVVRPERCVFCFLPCSSIM